MRIFTSSKIAKLALPVAMLAMSSFTAQSHADLVLTGDYDSTTSNANQVDVSATLDANANQLSLATFEALVESAFMTNTGGVATFDNAGDTISTLGNLVFADGTSLASISRIMTPQIQTGGGGRTPISGTAGVGGSTSYGFDFDVADSISAVGLTILSRAGNGSGNAEVIATFIDATGTPQAISVSSNLGDSNGGDDTFFGFEAPTGAFLTRVDVVTPYFTYTDDLAVVTTTAVPEPSSLLALGFGCALFGLRRRRA